MKPSEYFKRNCFSVEADEMTVPHFVDTFGDDNLIFSTDYPHGDSKYPHAVDSFASCRSPREQGEDRQRELDRPLRHPARQEGVAANLHSPATEAVVIAPTWRVQAQYWSSGHGDSVKTLPSRFL